MTLPHERTRAVIAAREFLTQLMLPPSAGGIAGVRREIREHARRLLRHYPAWFEVAHPDSFDAKAAEDMAAAIASREEKR